MDTRLDFYLEIQVYIRHKVLKYKDIGAQERTRIDAGFCIENKKLAILDFGVTHIVTRSAVSWALASCWDHGVANIILLNSRCSS